MQPPQTEQTRRSVQWNSTSFEKFACMAVACQPACTYVRVSRSAEPTAAARVQPEPEPVAATAAEAVAEARNESTSTYEAAGEPTSKRIK